MNLSERKAHLRAEMRSRRDAIPGEERLRLSTAIADRLLGLEEVRGASIVLLFYSFGSEPSTGPIAQRLHERRVRLLLPFLREGGMEAAEVRPGEALEPSGYGPKEPVRRVVVEPGEVDVVVTPGLAFDRTGGRLGYGGGHYDAYLTRMRVDALRVGIAFGFQLVEEVPAGEDDRRMRLVVTEDEVIEAPSSII